MSAQRIPGAAIYRWGFLADRPGLYAVVCHNVELAYMQGANVGNVHPYCVIDDFGNLVVVP